GKRFGRPEKKMPDQFKEICQKCKNGEVSTRQAADILGISHTTFYRRYRKEVEENVSNSRHFGTSE
ncbi:MAG: helix-turn-helix domain-containing protein, partial [Blautia sp.]|nr:helix-turn-helix domain-containing protein [Blautia sp.]